MNLQKHLKQLRQLSLRDDKAKGYGGSPQKFFDPFLPWFKVIVYKKGPYLVIDRYAGDERYAGQTITYFRKRPVYALNYYGLLTSRKFSPRVVFGFLKEALKAGADKSFHRGLNGYKNDAFLYKNIYTKKRGFMEGEEKIYCKGKLIYIQAYHGGIIEDSRTYAEWSGKLLPAEQLRKSIKL